MSRYVNSYQELVEIEQTRFDILLENTSIDNLFTILHQKLYTDRLYRYYYNKSKSDVQASGDTILIVPKSGYLTQRVIYLNPDLVGGTVAGTQIINITQQDGNIRLQDKGAVSATSLIRFLRSLFYAFGIEVDESKVNLIDLCNAVLSDFEFIYNRENGKSILIDGANFNNIDVMYILENGITYFDEDLVQAFANKMYEAKWFDYTTLININVDDLEVGDVIEYRSSKPSFEFIRKVCMETDNLIDRLQSDFDKTSSHALKLWQGLLAEGFDFSNYNFFAISLYSSAINDRRGRIRLELTCANVNLSNITVNTKKTKDGLTYCTFPYINLTDGYVGIISEYVPANSEDNKYVHYHSISTGTQTIYNTWIGFAPDTQTYSTGTDTTTVLLEEKTVPYVDGITIIDGAKIPTNIDSLSTDYPTWYERLSSWIGTGISKVGETLRNTLNVIDFVPLTLLGKTPTQAQSGEVTEPDIVGNVPEVVIKDLDPFPTSDEPSDDPYDPDVPDPTPSLPPPIPTPTPPVPPVDPTPSITSGKLFTVYNPTTNDINNLGGFLWGESIAGILAELFSNPMDAIISLNVIYATPSIGERRNIVLGYVKSDDITAPIVTSQYITLDCGTVRVPEYYGNATDYAPFACASIYLPFIGFRDVNINEIMGSEVNINYKIDVYTGTVYASVSTIRNGVMQVLYTYEGNCAVQIPLTGGDRSRLLGGVVGAVAGLAMGSPITAIGSVAGGVFNGATSNKQGSIGSNAGAMGIKNPYIIITNTQAYDAYNYNKQYGFPANASIQLGSCKGYTRVKSVHVSSISNATNEEKQNIDTLLKQGVIIN